MISVLDKGYVGLIDVMGDDWDICKAARVSTLRDEVEQDIERDKKLLRYLYVNGHTSPFEQVELKFCVYAPMMCVVQMLRHRTFNINGQSARYSVVHDEFYIPDTWRLQDLKNKQSSYGSLNEQLNSDLQMDLAELYATSMQNYNYALSLGVAKEQARLFIPAYGQYAKYYFKNDLHNWFHFLEKRLHKDAQWETRQYAKAILEYIEFYFPYSTALFKEITLKDD